MRSEIEKAIEKENLARESKYTGASEGKNSNVLASGARVVEEQDRQVQQQKDVGNYNGVKEAQEELVKCL